MLPITEDPRFAQAGKEARVSIYLSLGYMAWWYLSAYLPSGVEDYTYIFGLPSWFFLSCVAGGFSFVLVTAIVVRLFFKDLSLEPWLDKSSNINYEYCK